MLITIVYHEPKRGYCSERTEKIDIIKQKYIRYCLVNLKKNVPIIKTSNRDRSAEKTPQTFFFDIIFLLRSLFIHLFYSILRGYLNIYNK